VKTPRKAKGQPAQSEDAPAETTVAAPVPGFTSATLPWSAILADPADNARSRYPDPAELMADLRGNGLINPLTVRPDPKSPGLFRVVCGFRRHQALSELRKEAAREKAPLPYETVDVRVFSGSAARARLLTLAENHDRKDLRWWDVGDWCCRIKSEDGLNGEQIAQEVGYSKSYVNHCIAFVSKIHPEIQKAYRESRAVDGRDTFGLLTELVRLHNDPEKQIETWRTRTGASETPDPSPSPEAETDSPAKRAPTRRVLRRKLEELTAARKLSPTPEISTAWGVLRYTMGLSKVWPITAAAAAAEKRPKKGKAE
jgi:ParB family chromosome partitioning protein